MMQLILDVYDRSLELTSRGIPVSVIAASGVFDKLNKLKYDLANEDRGEAEAVRAEIDRAFAGIRQTYAEKQS